jgi:chemotaxis protein CheC
MGDIPENYEEKLHHVLQRIAESGIHSAAKGISVMVGAEMQVSKPSVCMVPLADIQKIVGEPENEVVAIYLRADGHLACQFMLILPVQKALELVDLMLGEPEGTTQELGSLERSALAELGNLSGTLFLNAVAAETHLEARPTPPAVMVDMAGAILDILLMSWDGISDHVLIIQSGFIRDGREAQVSFWVIPDRSTLEIARTRGLN